MDETQAPPAVTKYVRDNGQGLARDIADYGAGTAEADHSPKQMDLFILWLQGTVDEDSDESASKVPKSAGTS